MQRDACDAVTHSADAARSTRGASEATRPRRARVWPAARGRQRRAARRQIAGCQAAQCGRVAPGARGRRGSSRRGRMGGQRQRIRCASWRWDSGRAQRRPAAAGNPARWAAAPAAALAPAAAPAPWPQPPTAGPPRRGSRRRPRQARGTSRAGRSPAHARRKTEGAWKHGHTPSLLLHPRTAMRSAQASQNHSQSA